MIKERKKYAAKWTSAAYIFRGIQDVKVADIIDGTHGQQVYYFRIFSSLENLTTST